ncbi:MAG: triosephosphate isomerase [Thermoleophilia bacterium]|nr:triosephosphate isomerase [Thermoleophilia bacterium]
MSGQKSSLRPIVVAANWKMHKLRSEALEYLEDLGTWMDDHPEGLGTRVEVVVSPPFTSLELAVEHRPPNARIYAQNMHFADQGAFTGEVSPAMLRDLGVDGVLLGHSERRAQFNEHDAALGEKVVAAAEFGLRPMLCVGETLEERQGGHAEEVVRDQLETALGDLDVIKATSSGLSIAYEPVWAIGTGETATPQLAQEMHAFIRDTLSSIFTAEIAERIPVLYGGSVKPENAHELLSQPDIDGALVGGAALEVDSFSGIVAAGLDVVSGSEARA